MHQLDIVIVGAGFAGMQLLHTLRSQGHNAKVLEAGHDVGGTWYWNQYPGARCDVESLQYSYQFDKDLEQEWTWTEKYPAQPEILRYAQHVAARFDLRKDIQFDTKVCAATFDSEQSHWILQTDNGDTVTAKFFILATGALSKANTPHFEKINDYQGQVYHTGLWPNQGVDFSNQRVAVIGTGSSAIQAIPLIAEQARQLDIFQRTPSYSLPARNRLLANVEQNASKQQYRQIRNDQNASPAGMVFKLGATPLSALEVDDQTRQRIFDRYWEFGGMGFLNSFNDILIDQQANDYASEFVRTKIRAIVNDPKTAEQLCPTQAIGCKRACVDTDYYSTYNRDNVNLVSLKESPIEYFSAKGPVVAGKEYPVDSVVMATGFDAMTGAVRSINIQGLDGQRLDQLWTDGADNYLGLAIAGFPNLFTVCGPGSPSVLTNMLVSIHQHVEWISRCINELQTKDIKRIEANSNAQVAWSQEVEAISQLTLYPSCNSWYGGANINGKARVFMPYAGGIQPYLERINAIADNGYEGFSLTTN